ncbi:MAG TPA: hypothetical protein VF463_17450 [Sphingobium sp.]
MLVERSCLHIHEGLVEEFPGVMADKAAPLLWGLPGANIVSYGPGLENPSKIILLIASPERRRCPCSANCSRPARWTARWSIS